MGRPIHCIVLQCSSVVKPAGGRLPSRDLTLLPSYRASLRQRRPCTKAANFWWGLEFLRRSSVYVPSEHSSSDSKHKQPSLYPHTECKLLLFPFHHQLSARRTSMSRAMRCVSDQSLSLHIFLLWSQVVALRTETGDRAKGCPGQPFKLHDESLYNQPFLELPRNESHEIFSEEICTSFWDSRDLVESGLTIRIHLFQSFFF